jgi:hypothetical protein
LYLQGAPQVFAFCANKFSHCTPCALKIQMHSRSPLHLPAYPCAMTEQACGGLLDLPEPVFEHIVQAASESFSERKQKQHLSLRLSRSYRDLVLRATKKASLRLRLVPRPGDVAAASRLLGRLCNECQPGLDLSISMSREVSDLEQLLASAPSTAWEKVHTLKLQVSVAPVQVSPILNSSCNLPGRLH